MVRVEENLVFCVANNIRGSRIDNKHGISGDRTSQIIRSIPPPHPEQTHCGVIRNIEIEEVKDQVTPSEEEDRHSTQLVDEEEDRHSTKFVELNVFLQGDVSRQRTGEEFTEDIGVLLSDRKRLSPVVELAQQHADDWK
eukprot:CAMPEP_0170445440 /NCGR_PEP_ID=MMETSP0117_2-20130122/49065_1 /TAXON_ID=400756 /ORGANISM="Durinskia baltica, Strain CSIRO CS-38" /LENGTH=138 /DNA_ID=CAMNT_0010706321 /DNA_START=249 /DNA_END=665 /DNA_ORIENTATION=+